MTLLLSLSRDLPILAWLISSKDTGFLMLRSFGILSRESYCGSDKVPPRSNLVQRLVSQPRVFHLLCLPQPIENALDHVVHFILVFRFYYSTKCLLRIICKSKTISNDPFSIIFVAAVACSTILLFRHSLLATEDNLVHHRYSSSHRPGRMPMGIMQAMLHRFASEGIT